MIATTTTTTTTGTRAARRLRPVRAATIAAAAVAALALGLTGCADAAGDDGIATAGGDSSASPGAEPAGSGAGGEKLSDEERRLKFTECMREQGVDMPDPGAGGGVRFGIGKGQDPGTIDRAMEKCQQYAPNGGKPLQLNPEQVAKAREFAGCMRANGVPDFPDPDPDGRIKIQRKGAIERDAAFDAALEKCRQHAPMLGGRPGAGGASAQ